VKPNPPNAPAKPEDLFDPTSFPEDLTWVPAHQKLHPSDPVYLLLAWHWRRVKRADDTLQAAVLQLRTLLDARVATLTEAADTVAGINEGLADVQAALAEKPAAFAAQMDAVLAQPVDQAVTKLRELEKTLAPLALRFRVADRRQILAALLVGFTLGLLTAVVALLA
jgi:hypothetical protein